MKKFLIPIGVLIVAIAAIVLFNHNKNKNIITPEEVADNIYKLDYKGDYKLDDYLEAGINNADDYDKWFKDNLTDGINEKGLGVSILTLPEEYEKIDTDKKDLIVYSTIRMLLDKCASVDEAVEMLKNYDICCMGRHWYHLFVTDKSGKAVIVEWMNGDTFAVEDVAATNFFLHDDEHSKDIDGRYRRIKEALGENGTMSKETAMDTLANVKDKTCWSVIYDLDNFSFDVCFYEDFDKTYSFAEGDFK